MFSDADAEHSGRLGRLEAPALFITGTDDPNSTPEMSQAMTRLAPRGQLVVMPDARHMLTLTHANAVSRELRAFFLAASVRADDAPVDALGFRKALGSFLTGVTVVATLQEDGSPRGFTANSFTSVSLDPPLILVCIAKTASSYPIFSAAGHFSVNILAEHQTAVSGLFASKRADKFSAASWKSGPAGSPILDDVTAWFDCRRHDIVDAGDHVVLIGRVVGFQERATNPLGYCRGAHITFGLQLDALAASGGRTRVGAILEHDNRIVLVDDGRGGLDIPKGGALGAPTDSDSLVGNLKRLGLDAELGFLFAVYEDPRAAPMRCRSSIADSSRASRASMRVSRSPPSRTFPGKAFATRLSRPCCGDTSMSAGRTFSASTLAMPNMAPFAASPAQFEGAKS